MKDDPNSFQRRLSQRARDVPPMRVLVVDDDQGIVQLLQTALAAIDNYTVSTAASSKQALDQIEASDVPFDCLLLDIQMPETDGIVLLRKIRKLRDYADTPVIMLTAMSDRSYIDDAFVAGATDYITKPFDLIDLRGRMNAARRLLIEKKKSDASQRQVTLLEEELKKISHFNFDNPLVIEGGDRHLGFSQFNNYVEQLSRRKIFQSRALAIVLQDARTLFDATGCDYFREIVTETALCLKSLTSSLDCMFSYRGSGVFLVILHDTETLRAFPSEENLNGAIQTMLAKKNNADSWVNVVFGEPISMRSLSLSGAISTLNRAIGNAKHRETLLRQGDVKPIRGIASADPENGEKKRRRVYERVLLELYGENNYLNLK